ncbi:MAG TPA: inorganic phosphate transporter, partial [Vicinamibacterales bacterium]|nr:inorganic phosphate transporter [Vicinamibacterales bacterium]
AGEALCHTPHFGVLDSGVFGKTLLFILLAPMMGMAVAFVVYSAVRALFRNFRPGKVDRIFRRGQFLSAALYSIGHGGNDAQKTAGIIAAALMAAGQLHAAPGQRPDVPVWVILACHAAMGLGTLSGGWRIVRTMGMRITKLAPVGGFCAETSGAITLFMATGFGIPVSTTHTITGSIMGAGSVRKLSAVRWGVAGRIVWAWVLTIPGSALISALTYELAVLLGVPP